MKDEKRAAEIKAEIERLKLELKEASGECYLNLKNRRNLKYPYVFNGNHQRCTEVSESTLNVERLASIIKLVLAPEVRASEDGRLQTAAKKVKDFTPEEYAAVCACVDEVIDVVNRYNKELHPNGIAVGNYIEGQGLYKD